MIAAPIIVAAEIGRGDLAWLDALRKAHFPPERNVLTAHLTIFHHLPPGLLEELDTRLAGATRSTPKPRASVGSPINLGRGVALRVRCEALEALRADLADAFAGSLTPQDAAPWRAHVTIQNKVHPDQAKALLSSLSAVFAMPRSLSITGVATWFYRGGPWEPIAVHRFRG